MMCHADTSQATCSSFGITGFSLIAIDKVTSNLFNLELTTCCGFQLCSVGILNYFSLSCKSLIYYLLPEYDFNKFLMTIVLKWSQKVLLFALTQYFPSREKRYQVLSTTLVNSNLHLSSLFWWNGRREGRGEEWENMEWMHPPSILCIAFRS